MSFRTGHHADRKSQTHSESQRRFTDSLKIGVHESFGRNETKGPEHMTDVTNRSDFKAKVLPNIEPLLQVSLWLTRNGLDASKLMREALAEAYQMWNQSAPEESCGEWLRKILISRYSIGIRRHVRLTTPGSGDDGQIFVEVCPNTISLTASAQQQSWLAGDSDEDVNYLQAIASLPDVCRSAMILSYLEGFSNNEIADLAGVQPKTIQSALSRGRSFIRDELFEHLMGSVGIGSGAERSAAFSRN